MAILPRPTPSRPQVRAFTRRAFTMIELLVVILIIGILLALLLPAINSAIKTAKNAQVSSEIQGLQTALNQFKTAYSDYPPSRMYLNETGFYPTGSTVALAGAGMSDITLGQLAQRSLRYLQKFWPRATFSSTQAIYPNNGAWHDFNGNGGNGPDMGPLPGNGFIIQGHQCLTFFLGGIPYNTGSGIGMSGFGKNPTNPFSNMIGGNTMYRGGASTSAPSSTQPFFEFRPARLVLDPSSPYQIPGYVDPIGSVQPNPGNSVNFYAYFSSYGGSYDPNDVNFPEPDTVTGNAITGLSVNVNFTTYTNGGASNGIVCVSPSPNPYTASLTTLAANNQPQTSVFQSPNTFQIISSGADGLYGIGGLWTSTGGNSLPLDPTASSEGNNDPGIRQREADNLSNFNNGTLQ